MSVSVTSKNMVRVPKSKQMRTGEGPCWKKNDGERISCSWTGKRRRRKDGGGQGHPGGLTPSTSGQDKYEIGK